MQMISTLKSESGSVGKNPFKLYMTAILKHILSWNFLNLNVY